MGSIDSGDEYSEFRDKHPPANIQQQVEQGVLLLIQYDAEVEAKEEELKEAKKKRNQLKYVDLPATMKQAGSLAKFEMQLPDGRRAVVKREEKVSAKLSEGRADLVYAWLKANGHAHHITNDLVIPFTKGQEAELAKMEEYIKAYGTPVGYSCNEAIHSSTYTALCGRLKKAGVAIDDKVFGIHVVDQVDVDIK